MNGSRRKQRRETVREMVEIIKIEKAAGETGTGTVTGGETDAIETGTETEGN